MLGRVQGRLRRRTSVGRKGSENGSTVSPRARSNAHKKSFKTRAISTVVLLGAFIAIVWAGHVPIMFMILGVQTVMAKELFQISRMAGVRHTSPGPSGGGGSGGGGAAGPVPEAQQAQRLPAGFRALQWYIFAVTTLWVYTRFILRNLTVELTANARLSSLFGWYLNHHALAIFSLYCAGFVAFVLSLKRGLYRYQFSQFAWTHMILLVVVVPSSFFVSNIFDGLIWVLLPAACVICNDIAAYLAGFFFGRTPLIKISPKKTWEGFIGGLLGTVVLSWYLAAVLQRSTWLTCPRPDLSIVQPLACEMAPPIYDVRTYHASDVISRVPPAWLEVLGQATASRPAGWVAARLPAGLASEVSRRAWAFSFRASPMQLHAVVLATFASLIAPFGGFFASGFKRGLKIKDFGDSIPGHGGMTDRMDCQVVMAVFSYIYLNSYVTGGPDVAGVIAATVRLSSKQQLEVLERVANVLVGGKLLPPALGEAISAQVARSLLKA